MLLELVAKDGRRFGSGEANGPRGRYIMIGPSDAGLGGWCMLKDLSDKSIGAEQRFYFNSICPLDPTLTLTVTSSFCGETKGRKENCRHDRVD